MKYTIIVRIALVSCIILFSTFIPQIRCQTQKFEKKPEDTNVKLGDTAILHCSVSGTHGDVQWTHDGLALGYDRKVPGKPRYSVIWKTNDLTEYHLKIENVTIDDEGLFSCQAAPVGDWITKLEAKAKLTVLVGPETSPEIIFQDETRKPGEVVNFRAESETPTEYTCVVRRAKPAGLIKWFLNGTEIKSSVGTVKTIKSQSDLKSDMQDLTSVLQLKEKSNAIYNNSMIKCQAYHEAYGIKEELANMSSYLHIVVVRK